LSFKKVNQQERHELAQVFFEIDKDQSGLIEAQELIEFLMIKYPEFD
jgi:Ca2+-binding EF-hand superfamily protein